MCRNDASPLSARSGPQNRPEERVAQANEDPGRGEERQDKRALDLRHLHAKSTMMELRLLLPLHLPLSDS